eukprot:4036353-Prymnesium_polylepis.2
MQIRAARQRRLLRKEKAVGDSTLFDFAADRELLFDWLKTTDSESLMRFHTVQVMLNKAAKRIGRELSNEKKLVVYDAQQRRLPHMLDRILSKSDGDVSLSRFAEDFAKRPASDDADPAALFYSNFAPTLLLWLNEIASPHEREIFSGVISELRAFARERAAPVTLVEKLGRSLLRRPRGVSKDAPEED